MALRLCGLAQVSTAHLVEAFQCTSDVRPQCPNVQAGSATAQWLETTFGTNKNIFVDGTVVQNGTGGTLDIMSCLADVSYYVVTHLDVGFSPPVYSGGIVRCRRAGAVRCRRASRLGFSGR